MAQRVPLHVLLSGAWVELERKVASSTSDALQIALAAWKMRFGHMAPAGMSERDGGVNSEGQSEGAQVNFLEISGTAAKTVHQVTIRRDGTSVFEMPTISDHAGRLTTAGEILEAIAILSGRHGLYIDVRQHLLTTSNLEVEVTVMVGGASVAEQVGMRALVQT